MGETQYFFSLNPTEPWSAYPLGLPALGIVATLLVLVTLWTYRGQASSKRLSILVFLRVLALLVALITTIRPAIGLLEDPKVPSLLLLGIDMSESMTIPDELNNQSRISLVRKTLEKCQPILDELKAEQNVTIEMYGFGLPEFNEAVHKYDPVAPPKFNRSDYAVYLGKTLDRWQNERFIRAHLIIGDGAHNGDGNPEAEAGRWRQTGRAVHPFAVGSPTTPSDAKDVALTGINVVSGSPDGSVFIKTEFKVRIVATAVGFQGAKVPVKVKMDTGDGYKDVATETTKLEKESDNVIELTLKAPDKAGEIKLKVEIPPESVIGDLAPSNNSIETYVTVTKEGMRVLLVNRLGYENSAIRRALQADPRIDLYQVIRQTDEAATADEKEDFNFEERAYDVIIIGNIAAKQLTTLDAKLPAKIRDQVLNKGVGLLMTGGHATFLGTPGRPDATGWQGIPEILDILPVDLSKKPPVADEVFTLPSKRFQFLPVSRNADNYLLKLGNTRDESLALWAKLNDQPNRSRFTGLSKIGTPLGTATVFAVASDARDNQAVPVVDGNASSLAPLLVGHQIGSGNKGRVLVLAAQDTFLWQKLGQPQSNDGVQLHARFWRQMVRWLAHQENDEGAAFAKPDLPRLPVAGKQSIRVGLKQPGGAAALEPKFDLKVIAPGETEATASPRTATPDTEGAFRLPYVPAVPGEYTIVLAATGKDAKGAEVKAEARSRFFAFPEVSDEMLRKAANHDQLRKIATAGGGKFHRLEELPTFLRELKSQPMETVKPKPRYYPDWRRENSGWFLPSWFIVFMLLIGSEWALRRLWGLR
jgi:hypothetical protein